MMDQELALGIMLSGRHTLLTGAAGSGKTYVLREFVDYAKRDGKKVAVTATTGLAASHLGGATIHSWGGIGIASNVSEVMLRNMSKSRQDIIKKTDVLIIDEISMLHDYRLDMVDRVAREVRERLDEPFGGLQVILCGDFFQLPPVSRSDEMPADFVVNARAWAELDPAICYLDEQYRQDDDDYLEILTALRQNDIRRHHAERLLEQQAEPDKPEDVTELHVTNVDVDSINQRRLAQIDAPLHRFEMTTTGAENYVQSLKRSCLAPEVLELKEGALVMFLKNNQEKRYANGTTGEVVRFHSTLGYPIVRLQDGREVLAEPEEWEMRDGTRKRAGLTQIPLRLAWAITVHKSQGMTIDRARVDLRKAFVEGMGYVALSRVRNIASLELMGLNNMALRVSERAVEIDDYLRKKSLQDAEELKSHRTEAKQCRSGKRTPKKSTGDWQQKVAKMRETYPNAFRPWQAGDDKKLVKIYSDNSQTSIEQLSQEFGRHPGSIRARLKKHFGDDTKL